MNATEATVRARHAFSVALNENSTEACYVAAVTAVELLRPFCEEDVPEVEFETPVGLAADVAQYEDPS